MQKYPPSEFIPLYMWKALEAFYEEQDPHPSARTFAEYERVGRWYAATRRFREEQAWRILQIRSGWSGLLCEETVFAVCMVLSQFLRHGQIEEQIIGPVMECEEFHLQDLSSWQDLFSCCVRAVFQQGHVMGLVVKARQSHVRYIPLTSLYTVNVTQQTFSVLDQQGTGLCYTILTSDRERWDSYTWDGIELCLLDDFASAEPFRTLS